MGSEYEDPLFTDEDEDYQPPVMTKKRKRQNKPAILRVAEDYKIQDALTPARSTTYTAQALFEQIYKGDLDLDPEYQRDIVWNVQKQSKLIDSLFHNYCVPPIILCVTVHSDGSESRTCIDGKQRLTSIRLFMDGLIPHRDSCTGQQLWYRDNPGASRASKSSLLPEKYKKIFANKQIVCVEYGQLKPSDERDIFRRVQLGIALTAAEKINANATPRATFLRKLIAEYCTETTLCHPDISWDRERGKDLHVFGVAVICLLRWNSQTGLKTLPRVQGVETWMGDTRETKKTKKRQNDEDLDPEYKLPRAFCDRIENAFKILCKIATDKRYNTRFLSSGIVHRLAPLEVVGSIMLVYLTCTGSDSSSVVLDPDDPEDLLHASNLIAEMRKQIRDIHKEVRLNSNVARPMFDFLFDVAQNPFAYGFSAQTGGCATRTMATGRNRRPLARERRAPKVRRITQSHRDISPSEPAASNRDESIYHIPDSTPKRSRQVTTALSPPFFAVNHEVTPEASTSSQLQPPFDVNATSQAQMCWTQMMANSMKIGLMGITPLHSNAIVPVGTNGAVFPHIPWISVPGTSVSEPRLNTAHTPAPSNGLESEPEESK
ncbi:hypothetical protein VNI00_013086 [Paramarasmius palmivorus]|uniref:GmrSD restriction endonucleases N-terminal domain-containing protein n=1 Tax=Paramarasmius palmivorus TaxID=297713 RepID=A0AAW0C3L6_9AGAR